MRFTSVTRRVGGVDVARELVRKGYAAACPKFSRRYDADEKFAKTRRLRAASVEPTLQTVKACR